MGSAVWKYWRISRRGDHYSSELRKQMNKTFVMDTNKRPLMPCSSARANRLLKARKAAVYRTNPFTIILKYPVEPTAQPIEAKFDPGAKTTGIALVGEFPQQGRVVLFAANLNHRGDLIRKRLTDRLSIRRGRRGRKTRYRQPRFNNRLRRERWLPPSLQSRVDNVKQWLNKLRHFAPLTAITVETVRFDTQALQNPDISGIDYQRGTLAGYELREYLLEKWQRTCAYCGVQNVPLEIEHIAPRSKGGSNRVSNLTLACVPCNQKKGNQAIDDFLARDPKRLVRIQAQTKAPLKDAAAVNATRYAIGEALKDFGLPISFWSGGRTKKNRVNQGYAKDHWIDAACVGESGEHVLIPEGFKPLMITATGRGQRQVVRMNKYGFPCTKAKISKTVNGMRTGDVVKLIQPKCKYAGVYCARVTAINNSTQYISISVNKKQTWFSSKLAQIIQRGDGYAYANV
jgi:5-methylcytosine-specific restriction endonuclease McrA